MTQQKIISRFDGRTRYEGQPEPWDEVLVAEIERLRAAITAYGNNPAGFDFAILDKIDQQELEIERLRAAYAKLDQDVGILILDLELAKADRERLRSELKLVRGAMDAQDGRERQAGERCGVSWEDYGCDWPDAAADVIIDLKTAHAAERERLVEWMLEEIAMYNGCLTGDCPHVYTKDCVQRLLGDFDADRGL